MMAVRHVMLRNAANAMPLTSSKRMHVLFKCPYHKFQEMKQPASSRSLASFLLCFHSSHSFFLSLVSSSSVLILQVTLILIFFLHHLVCFHMWPTAPSSSSSLGDPRCGCSMFMQLEWREAEPGGVPWEHRCSTVAQNILPPRDRAQRGLCSQVTPLGCFSWLRRQFICVHFGL